MNLEKVQELMTRGEQNLLLLESLIPKGEKLYVWCWDREGQFIASSCPEEERGVLQQAFQILGGKEKLLQYAAEPDNTRPRIVGSSIGMQWALSYESERNRSLLFVIGPVFYTQPLEKHLRVGLRNYTGSRENARWAAELVRLLPALPVMSYAIFTRYVMLIHNMLTGQQLGLEALNTPPGRRGGGPSERRSAAGPEQGVSVRARHAADGPQRRHQLF